MMTDKEYQRLVKGAECLVRFRCACGGEMVANAYEGPPVHAPCRRVMEPLAVIRSTPPPPPVYIYRSPTDATQ